MIPAEEIARAVDGLAARVNRDYAGRTVPPLFMVVLNGAFMFAAELLRRVDFECGVSFVKMASYSGEASTGCVRELIGLNETITGRDVIVVEDIVETGVSMGHLLEILRAGEPASLEIAAMFFKPGSFRGNFDVKYRGSDIGDDFIVGFGLDYNELGRNLGDVYVTVG